MSLNDYPHRVDLILIDDRPTDSRMGRIADASTQTVTATGLHCRVNERDPERVAAFGMEATRHTHRIHFASNPGATVSHLIQWTPAGGSKIILRVKGTRRPRLTGFPWVVFAERIEQGPG